MRLVESLRENRRLLIIGALGYIAAADFGYLSPVWEMPGFYAVGTAGVVVAAAGFYAAGKVEGLLPDQEGIYIVAFESSDDTGGQVWEISEDQFDAMHVPQGTLFEWPTGKRVYECKEYRPEENIAVGNWRESVAGSQLAGDALLPDAIEQIKELREEFEPEAQRARFLKRRLRSIARTIDRRRLRDQQDLLDKTTNPSFGEERASVSQIVADEIPEELQPESMKGSNLEHTQRENGEDEETVGFELLDESEPLGKEETR
ncbi:hypothetical protein HRPV13_gp06 [Halorubrum pleomorphic virus 13]|nr:hypothetical protein HRPV13_gp06 [Halorubrum pleomorphic virus 13]